MANPAFVASHVRARPSLTSTSALSPRALASSRRLALASSSAAGSRAPTSSAQAKDLLVVGPGVLGTKICQQWLQKFPGAVVVGQTNTDASHAGLVSVGVAPRVKAFDADEPSANRTFPYVVFSAPPSGSEDYVAEVRSALKYWNKEGAFVFTSSSAVYANEAGEACDETSKVYEVGESPRVDRLLLAERAVLDAGGLVCRLAGLYHSERGAHKYFLKAPSLDSRADALVNLIHYEDAASLCVAALNSGSSSTVYLGTDGVPVTRGDIATLTLASGAYADGAAPVFTKTDGPLGRAMSNPWTRAQLNWQPRYASFKEFMTSGDALDSYSPRNTTTKSSVGFVPSGRPHSGA